MKQNKINVKTEQARTVVNREPVYKVGLLVQSNRYSRYADILNASFDTDDEISFTQADQAIQDYLERRV